MQTRDLELPFVGRESVLRALHGRVDAALAGRGGLVFLAGPAGSGKSRTCRELLAYAERRGMRGFVGRVLEDEGAPPLLPWMEVLQAIERALPEVGLAAEAPALHPDLARLFRHGLAAEDPRADPLRAPDASERFRLLEGVGRLLASASLKRPLAVLVEDVHAADSATLDALAWTAGSAGGSRLLVLATTRSHVLASSDPASARIAEVAARSELHELHAFDPSETDRLARLALGEAAGSELVSALQEASGGSPLLLTELIHWLGAAGGGSLEERLRSGPPRTIRTLLEHRVVALDDGDRSVLRVAALLGAACEASLLAEVAGLEIEPVDRALSAGEAHGLLEVRAEGPPRFSHALVREHLYSQLSARERRDLHQAAAKVLMRRHGESAAHAETILHHLLRAGGAEPGDETAAWRVHAARAAAGRFAWEEAARHYEAALEALERRRASEEERAGLWIELGTAQARRGAAQEAGDAFARARGLARELGSNRMLALAALGAKGDARTGAADQTSDPERVAIFEEALDGLEGEPVLRARLLAGLAMELYWTGDRERVEALAAEALAVARRLPAARERCEILIEVLTASWWPDNLDERLALADEALGIAEAIEHPPAIVAGSHLRSIAHIERGDVEAGERDIARAQEGAERWAFPMLRLYSRNVSVIQHLARGDYADAEALTKEQLAEGNRLGSAHMGAMHAAHMLQLLLSRGQAALAVEPLRRMAEQTGLGLTRASLAYVLCLEGREEEARAALSAVLDDGLDALPRDFFWLGSLAYLGEAAAHLGERAAAAAIRERLLPFAGRTIVVGFGTNHLGAVDRVLGVLAHCLGEPAEAADCLDRAIAFERRRASRPHLALALEARAALLDAEEGPTPRAASLRAEAAAIREATGLRLVAPEVTLAERSGEAPDDAALLENRGADGWRVRFAGREAKLPDARGLVYLAELVVRPGEEVHVLDLLARVAPEQTAAPTAGGGDELMDARARSEVRARMESLRGELADAEERADLGRAEQARAELEALEDSLAAAFGLGGRARRAGDATERARKAVYNRIRAVTRRLEALHPELAAHLRNSVQTGRTCVYRPERLLEWRVRVGAR